MQRRARMHYRMTELTEDTLMGRLVDLNITMYSRNMFCNLTLYSALYTFVYTKSNTSPHSIQHANNISYLLYQ